MERVKVFKSDVGLHSNSSLAQEPFPSYSFLKFCENRESVAELRTQWTFRRHLLKMEVKTRDEYEKPRADSRRLPHSCRVHMAAV